MGLVNYPQSPSDARKDLKGDLNADDNRIVPSESHRMIDGMSTSTSRIKLPSQPQRALHLLDAILNQRLDKEATWREEDYPEHLVHPGPVIILPTGSLGLQVWEPSTDVDILCIGPFSDSIFRELACEQIREAYFKGVDLRILSISDTGLGNCLELEIDSIKLNIQYCHAVEVAKALSQGATLTTQQCLSELCSLSLSSLKRINTYRDVDRIVRTTPYASSFRSAHCFIRDWAQARGLFSSRHGYLSDMSIALLLSRICSELAESGSTEISAPEVVFHFFKTFTDLDWAQTTIVHPTNKHEEQLYNRSAGEAMAVLTIHEPVINTTYNTSPVSLQIIQGALRRGLDFFLNRGVSLDDMVGLAGSTDLQERLIPGSEQFLQDYSVYVLMEVENWGRSPAATVALGSWLEMRFVRLVRILTASSIFVRPWPARFVAKGDDSQNPYNESSYHGFFVMGISDNKEGPIDLQSPVPNGSVSIQRKVDQELEAFEADIKSEDEGGLYDSSTSWVRVSQVSSSEIASLNLQPDLRQWERFPDKSVASFEQENLRLLSEKAISLGSVAVSSSASEMPITSERSTQTTLPESSKKTTKLRPASDILHRLKWDPAINQDAYLVGYDDRFAGRMWMKLANWKTEQTDDEFIPLHRIVQFRKGLAETGEIIWDREKKMDRLFGSGVGS